MKGHVSKYKPAGRRRDPQRVLVLIATHKLCILSKHVFSRLGSTWKMGSSLDRGNSSRGNARLYFVYNFLENIGFPARGRVHDFCRFSSKHFFPRIGPEVTVGSLGVVSTRYYSIWSLSGPFRTEIRKTTEKNKKYNNKNSY